MHAAGCSRPTCETRLLERGTVKIAQEVPIVTFAGNFANGLGGPADGVRSIDIRIAGGTCGSERCARPAPTERSTSFTLLWYDSCLRFRQTMLRNGTNTVKRHLPELDESAAAAAVCPVCGAMLNEAPHRSALGASVRCQRCRVESMLAREWLRHSGPYRFDSLEPGDDDEP
jgi:hypothetical protein